MEFFIAGGNPNNFREAFIIKDSDGYISSTEEYIRSNPELFTYMNTVTINSVRTHFFQFRTGS